MRIQDIILVMNLQICLLNKYDCSFRTERKFKADIFDININGEKVIVAKPLTYMNLSGDAVKKIC